MSFIPLRPVTCLLLASIGSIPVAGCSADLAAGAPGIDIDAAVANVIVTPTNLSLAIGDSARVTVILTDAHGAVLSGRAISFSAIPSETVTISPSGLVTALAAHPSVQLTATSEGHSGAATLVIAMPSPGPEGGQDECAASKAGWLWCDDFEVDRLDSYFEYDSADGNFSRRAAVGHEGSYGMRVHFETGTVSAGALHLAIGLTPLPYFRPVDAGIAKYREIFWRMYVRHQPGWQGGGGNKLSRAFIFAAPSWGQAMVAHMFAGSPPNQDYLYLDPVSGTDVSGNLQTTRYNDFDNFRYLGSRRGTTPLFSAGSAGQWYCVEAHVRLNAAGSSDGVQEFWVNENLEASRTDLNWVGSYTAFGINAVYFENFWNNGSPVAQDRSFDRIIVSTQRVGC